MLEKVISGCQTGADLGGLLAAEAYGILTGGHVPKNCRTEDRDHPEYIERFGLTETESTGYEVRTELNVQNSDGTLIICSPKRLNSPGTRLTRNLAKRHRKPSLIILWIGDESFEHVQAVVNWIMLKDIRVLNVAGNRESKALGIQAFVQQFLMYVFVGLRLEDARFLT